MLNAYADASGDHNPIHIDEAFAKTTPMGGTIAHGMLVLSFISEMMAGAFGAQWLSTGSLDVRFRAPARPGDTVTARATAQDPKDGRLRYAVECVSQTGEQLISGTAEVAQIT
jgi:3-hydroxybutyryl-CoA dehydratase